MSTSTITLDGNPVTLVALPAWPPPSMVEPWVNDSVASITFPFTGQTQTQGSSGADIHGMNVTYPPLVEAQAAPFRAWLKQMRGISRAFQWTPADYVGPAGSPSGSPYAGTANANLVPDSNVLDAWTYWVNPGGGWTIGPSGGGPNAFFVPSGSYLYTTSAAIPVVPGQTYTFSCYIQSPAYTLSSTGGISVEVIYAGGLVYVAPPTSGGAGPYSVTFTVPAGVTSVNIWVGAQGATWTSGQLIVSTFQLQVGSVASAYAVTASSTVQAAASTTLLTAGWTPGTFGLLLQDDLFQLGYRLHAALDIVTADANGNASFEIFPSLREDVITGQPLITGSPQGLFRLANNKRNWSKDFNQLTHLSFPISEYR
jgi:hypothetical protein